MSQKYLFDRYAEAMLMVCMRYVKNLHDAEELMLTGFQKFYSSIARFTYAGEGSVGAWLKKIIVNECLGFLRKAGTFNYAGEAAAITIADSSNVLHDLSAAEIFRLITALPPGYRTVFNLFVVEGYTHREIAGLLGISEGASKSQLSKARHLLQTQIKQLQQ